MLPRLQVRVQSNFNHFSNGAADELQSAAIRYISFPHPPTPRPVPEVSALVGGNSLLDDMRKKKEELRETLDRQG